MDFVAIDFETANEKRHSPCSLGITVVKNNQIISEKYWLIRPHELRFNPMNIWIHGIHPETVEHKKNFKELWPEILPFLENQLVIAHNASFDISVLRRTLDLYNIPYPSFQYCCTMVMSRHFYYYLENAKLNTVNQHLGYHFNHHDARADATACANILLAIATELNVSTIEALTVQVGTKIGEVFERGYTPASSNGGGVTSNRQLTMTSSTAPTICQTSFFKDKVVAFTGPLSSMPRCQAIGLVETGGGDYTPSVTLKTNVVVTGMKNPLALAPHQMSGKLRRALELRARGQSIQFLTEEEFLSYL
ncbi:MAG: exonuclease domain-containing protein [Cellulosilyticaceae bacterium]